MTKTQLIANVYIGYITFIKYFSYTVSYIVYIFWQKKNILGASLEK